MTDAEISDLIERTLDAALPAPASRPRALSEALRYAVGSGGKRIRPRLCLAAAEAAGGCAADAAWPAAAIELLHNYTLVHDDLPAMDNDVERRGKPSVWKQFGEANAILAADALQALAFAAAAKAPRNTAAIVAELAEQGFGVVAGQVEDVAPANGGARDIPYIYRHKTADLFMAATVMGSLAGGGSEETTERLRAYALNLGLAFQFEDDLLDGDMPYPADETRRLVTEHTAQALAALDGLPGPTERLHAIATALVGRKV